MGSQLTELLVLKGIYDYLSLPLPTSMVRLFKPRNAAVVMASNSTSIMSKSSASGGHLLATLRELAFHLQCYSCCYKKITMDRRIKVQSFKWLTGSHVHFSCLVPMFKQTIV